MVDQVNNNERVTGQDAILKFNPDESDGLGKEFKVSNVSWSRDVGSTNVQHNDGLKSTKAVTSIDFSGSFEYSGQSIETLRQVMYSQSQGDNERHEPKRGTLSVREEDEDGNWVATYNFKGVLVTSHSRDLPSGDSASSSFDWEAEDMKMRDYKSV